MPEEFEGKKWFVRYKEGAKLYGLCQSTFLYTQNIANHVDFYHMST